MREHATFEFSSSLEKLRRVSAGKSIPDELLKPLNTIASTILSRVSSGRKSFCLTSSEADKQARDLFGNILVRVLTSHNDSTVLIDCDFTNVGLSGAVVNKDALGFLDMLLYGSSFSSAVQESRVGAKVIGPGSFPVNKKMPFSLEAFESTVRYMQNQSDCAIYCCPIEDDEGHIHPILSSLGYAIVVTTGGRMGPAAALEERLESEEGIEFITVSMILKAEEEIVVDEAPREVKPAPVEEIEVSRLEEIPSGEEEAGEPVASGRHEENGKEEPVLESEDALIQEPGSSFVPKLLTIFIGVSLVAFLIWWMIITKPMREDRGVSGGTEGLLGAMVDTAGERGARGDTAMTRTASIDSSVSPSGEEAAADAGGDSALVQEPAKTAPDTSFVLPPKKPASSAKPALKELDSFRGKYLVHISSFKKLENAEKDAAYLLRKGFPAFVTKVDLGNKGVWFRVYSGPYDARSEALESKIKLDELSRVKFTRLTKIR